MKLTYTIVLVFEKNKGTPTLERNIKTRFFFLVMIVFSFYISINGFSQNFTSTEYVLLEGKGDSAS